MKQAFAVALSTLIGFMFGALHAHKKPRSAYAVIETDDITDQATFAAAYPKLLALSEAFGDKTIIEAGRITGRDMVPPKRFAVIASAQGELDRIRDRSAKTRSFLVDGAP